MMNYLQFVGLLPGEKGMQRAVWITRRCHNLRRCDLGFFHELPPFGRCVGETAVALLCIPLRSAPEQCLTFHSRQCPALPAAALPDMPLLSVALPALPCPPLHCAAFPCVRCPPLPALRPLPYRACQ